MVLFLNSAAIFSVAICLKVFNSTPAPAPAPRHSLALLPQGGLHSHRTLQASATEGWFMPTLHPEALLVGAGCDGWKSTGQGCETCPFFPFTLNDSALKWEQRWGLAWGVTAQEEKDPDMR